MSDIYPVSRARHGNRRWNKTADFGWARREQVVAIALQEASQLMMALPLGFVRHESQIMFVVLLGLRPGESLMVGPDGRWLAPRIPVFLQHYPFRQMRTKDGQEVLGVDESGLLPPDALGGTLIYDETGPLPEVTRILEQLVQGDKERQQASGSAGLLDEHGLLEPWELQVQDEHGAAQRMEGLYRINEKKLNELPGDTLVALRNGGALLMAYCQLLSMQHIHQLGQLAAAMARHAAAKAEASKAAADHGIISFANL